MEQQLLINSQNDNNKLASEVKSIKYPIRLRLKKHGDTKKYYDHKSIVKQLANNNLNLRHNVNQLTNIVDLFAKNHRAQQQKVVIKRTANFYNILKILLARTTKCIKCSHEQQSSTKQRTQNNKNNHLQSQRYRNDHLNSLIKRYNDNIVPYLESLEGKNSISSGYLLKRRQMQLHNRQINQIQNQNIHYECQQSLQRVLENFFNLLEEIKQNQLQMQIYILNIKQQLDQSGKQNNYLKAKMQELIQNQDFDSKQRYVQKQQLEKSQMKTKQLAKCKQSIVVNHAQTNNEQFLQSRHTQKENIQKQSQHSMIKSVHFTENKQMLGNILKSYMKIDSMHELQQINKNQEAIEDTQNKKSCKQQRRLSNYDDYQNSINQTEKVDISRCSIQSFDLNYLAQIHEAAEKSAKQYQLLMYKYKQLLLEKETIKQQACQFVEQTPDNLQNYAVKMRYQYEQRQLKILQMISDQLDQLINNSYNIEPETLHKMTLTDKILTLKQLIQILKGYNSRNNSEDTNTQNQEQNIQYPSTEINIIDQQEMQQKQRLILSTTSSERLRDAIDQIQILLLQNQQILSVEHACIQKIIQDMVYQANLQKEHLDVDKLKVCLTKLQQNIRKLRHSNFSQKLRHKTQVQDALKTQSELIEQIQKLKLQNIEIKRQISQQSLSISQKFIPLQKLGHPDPHITKIETIEQDNNQNKQDQFNQKSSSILKNSHEYSPEYKQFVYFLSRQFQSMREDLFPNSYELTLKIEMDIIKLTQVGCETKSVIHYAHKIFKAMQENELRIKKERDRKEKVLKHRKNKISEICKKASDLD